MKPDLAGMQFLKVQMNADLLTEDLEKERASDESFWLIGQPDVYPRQVFFPLAGEDAGWARLAKNLEAEIDAYRGTVSLPFERGQHKRIAVRIVDDRGIESLKVIDSNEAG